MFYTQRNRVGLYRILRSFVRNVDIQILYQHLNVYHVNSAASLKVGGPSGAEGRTPADSCCSDGESREQTRASEGINIPNHIRFCFNPEPVNGGRRAQSFIYLNFGIKKWIYFCFKEGTFKVPSCT